MTAKLELHLKLDGFQVENQWHDGHGVVATRLNLVEDSSGNKYASALFGKADIVADDVFGACADFDGDAKSYIKVPSAQPLKITGDVTVEAWVYITKAATSWVRVIGKGTFDSRSYGLWYLMTGPNLTCLFQRGHGAPFDDCKALVKTTPLNAWYHLAGVVEGKKSSLYVHDLKGKLIEKGELDNKSSGAQLDNDSHVIIGHSLFPNHPAHAGKIAHARIYKGALSQAEIERDISSDRLALVPFRKSHPIDFRLSDEDDQPALYVIDDAADAKNSLKVEFTNSATQAIRILLPPLPTDRDNYHFTDPDHHHFALRFRPGTLSASTIRKLIALTSENQSTVLNETDAHHWELAGAVGLTGPVTLYVSHKGPEDQDGQRKKLFLPEEQLTLTLRGISADAGSGSRGTQVELIPHQLTYEGDETPITGSRMRYIHITNHRGQKNIPLHVWFVNGNTVLNDGKSTTDLKLRISNGSADRDIILNEKSRFVISFDVGEDWALTDKANADKVKVTQGETELPRPGHGQATNETFREWELKFSERQVLAKRGSTSAKPLEIVLKGIKTDLSSGHANLYVRYEDIPGYQDGQFILVVEKSPLKYSNGKIDVAGALVADKLSVSRKNEVRGGLFFATAGDFNHVVYNNLSNLDGEGNWDGAKWNTFQGLNIRVGDQGIKPSTLRSALLINATGHVGIGTVAPEAKLEIALDDKDTATNSLVIRKGTTNYLTIRNDGNVQIEKMLDVRGALQVREVTASQSATPSLAVFYDKDTTQGLAIGYNHIASIGARPNQSILIEPKGGLGRVEVKGPLQVGGTLKVNGLPIFDYGKRMTEQEWRSQAAILESDANYRPGCFILFVREHASDDLCYMVKKPNNEVRLYTLYCTGEINLRL
jgi:hypothetical protein